MPLKLSYQQCFLVFLLLLGIGSPVSSAPVDLIDHRLEQPLNSAIEYIEDPAGELTIEQVLNGNRSWHRHSGGTFNKGYSTSAWWFRFEIRNPGAEPVSRMLELSYAILDYVNIYIVRNGQVAESFLTGDQRPYDTRPVSHRFFVLPVTLKPEETLEIFYRIESTSSIQAPFTLWEPQAFHEYEAKSSLLQGLYYGAMAIILVYNLLIFLILWDRSYLYYVGFVASGPFFFLALSGQGYRYLWTGQVWWNAHSVAVFVSCLILFGALFTRNFIGLKHVSVALDRVILSFALVGAVLLGLSFLLPYKTMIALLVPLSILACISDLVAGSVAWYRGVKPARFYVFAWACFLLGTIIMAFQKAGLLPNNAWTEYSVQFGSALEAVLLSFAMADRIQTERRLRLSAQEETIQTARRLNEELEKRVDERTSELATLNKRLEELSNTDQLTDLHNRRYLVEAGHREWHRCARGKHPISVLILDVDYFKQVNDNYGHSTGDLCLQRIAGSLRGVLRSSVDVVARYGGEEFCVVLPETDKQGALCVAERLRKDIEDTIIKHGDLMLQVTVSIGLHTVRPDKGGTFEEALHVADKGLYQAKENGRNQVGTVGATLKVQQ